MSEAQDLDALKRRGRRRLVGAVALVLLAVIGLPMVFDPEPRQAPPPVSVRIPGEDESAFTPKVTPKAPPQPVAPSPPARTAAAPDKPAPPPAADQPAAKPAAEKSAAKPARPDESERARAALANAEFVVQVAALADPERVKDLTGRLAAAKLPYYTEPVATASGKVTRVRAGPFDSKEAAERALEKIRSLGLPGKITTRAG